MQDVTYNAKLNMLMQGFQAGRIRKTLRPERTLLAGVVHAGQPEDHLDAGRLDAGREAADQAVRAGLQNCDQKPACHLHAGVSDLLLTSGFLAGHSQPAPLRLARLVAEPLPPPAALVPH